MESIKRVIKLSGKKFSPFLPNFSSKQNFLSYFKSLEYQSIFSIPPLLSNDVALKEIKNEKRALLATEYTGEFLHLQNNYSKSLS